MRVIIPINENPRYWHVYVLPLVVIPLKKFSVTLWRHCSAARYAITLTRAIIFYSWSSHGPLSCPSLYLPFVCAITVFFFFSWRNWQEICPKHWYVPVSLYDSFYDKNIPNVAVRILSPHWSKITWKLVQLTQQWRWATKYILQLDTGRKWISKQISDN